MNNYPNTQELDALASAIEAATPGPWARGPLHVSNVVRFAKLLFGASFARRLGDEEDDLETDWHNIVSESTRTEIVSSRQQGRGVVSCSADTDLICLVRNLAPRLLSAARELDAMRAARDAAEIERDEWKRISNAATSRINALAMRSMDLERQLDELRAS